MSSSSSYFLEGEFDYDPLTQCHCKKPVKLRTSWSGSRKFVNCDNYLVAKKKCDFFDWVKPEPTIDWYKAKLLEEHEKLKSANKEKNKIIEEHKIMKSNMERTVKIMKDDNALYKSTMHTKDQHVQMELKKLKWSIVK
ncbi:hypothetical protein L1887_08136 [Cichorium endivia]|nr:hypothetical protein L1887_08136 [Cichorium endivia]